MEKDAFTINIIGAGISGLVAALVLEEHGYAPHLFEASNSVGGRVKTDIIEDYQLDHGFQVLLSAYPMAKKYLDFEALSLQEFLPGAQIYHSNSTQIIGDPLRSSALLFPTLFANAASLKDKFKIYNLNKELQGKTLEEVFTSKEVNTLTYLQEKGFSDKIINRFFRPFFSGIFLEPHLETSSRMFEYVYKMFGEGLAVLPAAGIGAIPTQLATGLKSSKIHYNTAVVEIGPSSITLSPDIIIDSDYTLIATEAKGLVPNLAGQPTAWRSCDTLYFETEKNTINKPLIGLIADEDALINNIFFHNVLKTRHQGKKELLSVTVVKSHELGEQALVDRVVSELAQLCDIRTLRFLKHYPIRQALPKLTDLQYDIAPSATQLNDTVFIAGDQLLNGSLNAAMIAGERAALGLVQKIESKLFSTPLSNQS